MQLNLNQFHSMVYFSGCSVNIVIHKLQAVHVEKAIFVLGLLKQRGI
jgi:hypothetical protein